MIPDTKVCCAPAGAGVADSAGSGFSGNQTGNCGDDVCHVNDFAISQTQPQAAIGSGSWKLIHHFESGRDELFDLRNDPSESNDLTKSNPPRSAALREALLTRLAEFGARMPRPKP